jgi:very-short-patch-repair endonuclease
MSGMSRTFELEISALASVQCGVFSRAQALACGASRSLIGRRLASGAWQVRHPGVYAVAAVPGSWHQQVWAALLAVGPRATVTHETALRIHGCGDDLVPRHPLTFTIPHGGHARIAGATVHQIDDLAPSDIVPIDGLPISRPHRAVVEVAATVGARQLGNIVDELLMAELTSHDRIAACLARVARPGKPGVIKLGDVLDQRGDGYLTGTSELERALFAALDAAGLPTPRHQVPLPGRGALVGVVDAAYDDARLIIEADGRRWHTRTRDLKRDHLRDAEAARVGWQTLRFVYEQIVGDPHEVCAVVRDVRAARLALVNGPPTLAAREAGGPEAMGFAPDLSRQLGPAPGAHCLVPLAASPTASGC